MHTSHRRLLGSSLLIALLTGCSSSSDSDAVDTTPPSASIDFPSTRGLTESATFTVRGQASDNRGIASVSVNGVEASSTDGFATWQVTLPLELGDNDLNLSVIDIDGNRVDSSAEASIQHTSPLLSFTDNSVLDPTNNRLLTENSSNNGFAIFAVDLESEQRQILSNTNVGSGPLPSSIRAMALDSANNRLIVATSSIDDLPSSLLSIDLSTGDREVLFSSDPSGNSLGLSRVQDMVVDSANNRVLFIQEQLLDDSIQPEGLLAFDLASRELSLIVQSGQGSLVRAFDHLVFNATNNQVFIANALDDQLFSVNLDSPTLVPVNLTGETFVLEHGITLDADNNRLLTLNASNQPVAIDLGTGLVTLISTANNNAAFNLGAARMRFDSSGNRLIIDEQFGNLFTLDLNTAELQLFARSSTGDGEPLNLIFDDTLNTLTLDPANERAILTGQNQGQLTVIDLNNGNRSLLLSLNLEQPPLANFALSSTLDIDNSRLLIISNLSNLIAVDLDTSASQVLIAADDHPELLPGAGAGLALDAAQSRALVLNGSTNSVLALDLNTGQPSLLADNNQGSGPELQRLSELVLDSRRQQALILADDPEGEAFEFSLLSLDLNTNERRELLAGIQPLVLPLLADQLVLDSNNDRLIIGNDEQLIIFDLVTETVSAEIDLVGFSPVATSLGLESDTLLFADLFLDALVQVDLMTGETLILSR